MKLKLTISLLATHCALVAFGATASASANTQLAPPAPSTSTPVLAVNDQGQAVAAWRTELVNGIPTAVQASFFDGRAWSAPTPLSGFGTAGTVKTAIDGAGRAYVAWTSSLDGGATERSPLYISSFAGTGWSSPQLVQAISTPVSRGELTWDLAADEAGNFALLSRRCACNGIGSLDVRIGRDGVIATKLEAEIPSGTIDPWESGNASWATLEPDGNGSFEVLVGMDSGVYRLQTPVADRYSVQPAHPTCLGSQSVGSARYAETSSAIYRCSGGETYVERRHGQDTHTPQRIAELDGDPLVRLAVTRDQVVRIGTATSGGTTVQLGTVANQSYAIGDQTLDDSRGIDDLQIAAVAGGLSVVWQTGPADGHRIVGERIGDRPRPRAVLASAAANGAISAASNGLRAHLGFVTQSGANLAPNVVDPPANTQQPALIGTASPGSTLQVDNGQWSDGAVQLGERQVLRCGTDGDGCAELANSVSQAGAYTVQANDLDQSLRVRVFVEGVLGRSAENSEERLVGSAPDLLSSPEVTAQMPAVGQPATASAGVWRQASGMSITSRWLRCGPDGGNCTAIPSSAANVLMLNNSVRGHTVVREELATNGFGTATARSRPYPRASWPDPGYANGIVDTPTATTAPTVAGPRIDDGALVANLGTWSDAPLLNVTYTWLECPNTATAPSTECTALAPSTARDDDSAKGALGSIGRILPASARRTDRAYRVVVEVANARGGAAATSGPLLQTPVLDSIAPGQPERTGTAAPGLLAAPSLSSGKLTAGSKLKAQPGSWTNASSVSLVWKLCDRFGEHCSDVSGAGGQTHTVVCPRDNGSTYRLLVTATNSSGTSTYFTRNSGTVVCRTNLCFTTSKRQVVNIVRKNMRIRLTAQAKDGKLNLKLDSLGSPQDGRHRAPADLERLLSRNVHRVNWTLRSGQLVRKFISHNRPNFDRTLGSKQLVDQGNFALTATVELNSKRIERIFKLHLPSELQFAFGRRYRFAPCA